MQIELKQVMYDLTDIPNRTSSRLQFSIVKGEHLFDEIIEDADGNETIDVYEDGEKIAIYNGYSNLFVACYVKEQGSISIELLNEDMQSQIDAIGQEQDNQQGQIDSLNSTVNDITPKTMTEIGYIDDTSVTFTDVPQGKITVYFDGIEKDCEMERVENNLIVYFEPLEEVTSITISIS